MGNSKSRFRAKEVRNDAIITQQKIQKKTERVLHTVTAINTECESICASGWDDASIQFTNWQTNETLLSCTAHERSVNQIIHCNSMNCVFSCSRDKTIVCHKVLSYKPIQLDKTFTLSGHTLNVSSITQQERVICSGGRDTQTIFWDLETQTIIFRTLTPQNVITCCKYAPTENVVAQTSEDLTVKFWDPRDHRKVPVQLLQGYTFFPLSVDISHDSLYVVTASKGFNGFGGEVRVWDRRNGKQLANFTGHQQDATACCLIHSERYPGSIVSASKDGTIRLWDVKRHHGTIACLEPNHGMYTSMCMASADIVLASTLQGSIQVYKLEQDDGKGLTLLAYNLP